MKVKLNSHNLHQYLINTCFNQEQHLKSIKIEREDSNNWAIAWESGYQIFVKQELYDHKGSCNRKINNEWKLYNFFQSCQDLSYTASLNLEILHFDDSNSILIYKYPKDYINLNQYYRINKTFVTAIPELLGTTLATLHRETVNSRQCFDFMNNTVESKFCNQFPYSIYMQERIEPEIFFSSPSEFYKFVALYQRYESLRAAATELLANHHPYCLTHNNPLLNSILIPNSWKEILSQENLQDKSIIRMINWESCSWGDPAFDLGRAIADYLLLWLNSLIVHPAIELEQSLQLATIPLEVIQPSILALTKGYSSSFPDILENYPNFLKRVIQFTGLALIFHLLAMIESFQGFNNQSICKLQVAKKLLCTPEKLSNMIWEIPELKFS